MQEIHLPLSVELLTDLIGDTLCEKESWTPRHRGSAWEMAAVFLLVHKVASVRHLRPNPLPSDFADRFGEYASILWQQLEEDDPGIKERPESFQRYVEYRQSFSGEARVLLDRLESWLRGQHPQFERHWILRRHTANDHRPNWFTPVCG